MRTKKHSLVIPPFHKKKGKSKKRFRKMRGGGDDGGLISRFWSWLNTNVVHTVWFSSLQVFGWNIWNGLKVVWDFIWGVLTDIWVKKDKSMWLWIIIGLVTFGIFDANLISAAATTGAATGVGATGAATSVAATGVAAFVGDTFSILWGIVMLLLYIFNAIPFAIAFLVTNSLFVPVLGAISLSVMVGGYIMVYRSQYEKWKNIVDKNKENAEKKKRGGGKFMNTMDSMFDPSVLSKLNSIPKEEMDELIKKDPFPFSMMSLFGFMKETETGYVFSQESMDRIKSSLEKTMENIKEDNEEKDKEKDKEKDNEEKKEQDNDLTKEEENLTKEDLDYMTDYFDSLKTVQLASMHALARDSIDEGEKKEGGGKGSGRRPKEISDIMKQLKLEDTRWIQQQNPKNFKKAKKSGLFDKNMKLTEKSHKMLEDSIRQAKAMMSK